MHPERVVITRVSATVVAIVVAVIIVAAVGAFGSLLLGHLFSIIQVIVVGVLDRQPTKGSTQGR
jgi:hypothetical protein